MGLQRSRAILCSSPSAVGKISKASISKTLVSEVNSGGHIVIGGQFNVSVSSIGDNTSGLMLAHKAVEEAIAAEHLRSEHGQVDNETLSEVAWVGRIEQELKKYCGMKSDGFSSLRIYGPGRIWIPRPMSNAYSRRQNASPARISSVCHQMLLLYVALAVSGSGLFLFILEPIPERSLWRRPCARVRYELKGCPLLHVGFFSTLHLSGAA